MNIMLIAQAAGYFLPIRFARAAEPWPNGVESTLCFSYYATSFIIMAGIQLTEPAAKKPTGWSPFALGFRPFFLLAGICALLYMGIWVVFWHSGVVPDQYYGRIGWHTHEMLFGYALAVIAGFLLTAVRNWTGIQTPSGLPLAGLAGVWLAARILPWFEGVPDLVIAGVDLVFVPLLMVALAGPLWRGKNKRNRLFIGFFGMMFLANLLVHGDALGILSGWGWRGTQLMLDSILLILVFVAGRVMPFFVEMAVAGSRPLTHRWLEALGYGLFGLMIIAHLLDLNAWFSGAIILALALAHGLRLWGWYHPGLLGIPILWILFAGYSWLVLGLLASGLAQFGIIPRSPAIHTLTVGAIGVLTLGMMARVALGHTGRPLVSAVGMNVAFVIINLAVILRVLGPLLAPLWWWVWYALAGLLWVMAFGIFVVIYTPILVRPRVDGAPG